MLGGPPFRYPGHAKEYVAHEAQGQGGVCLWHTSREALDAWVEAHVVTGSVAGWKEDLHARRGSWEARAGD